MSNSPILNIPGIENGTVDGNTLRWEASTGRWEENSALVVADSGNVGIGTNAPQAPLAVSEGGALGIEFSPQDSLERGRILCYDRVESAYKELKLIGLDITFNAGTGGGAERMRIDSAGNVGIGTTLPNSNLHVRYDNVNQSRIKVENAETGDSFPFITIDCWGSNGGGVASLQGVAAIESGVDNGLVYSSFNGGHRWLTSTGRTERMRIDSSGNVGIGTTSPDAVASTKLTVASHLLVGGAQSSTGNPLVRIQAPDTVNQGDISFQVISGGLRVYDNVDVAERMRIDSSGNLLVGTTDASLATTTTGNGIVNNTVAANHNYLAIAHSATASSSAGLYINKTFDVTASAVSMVSFRDQGVEVGSIGMNNAQVFYNTGCDAALKDNIEDAQSAIPIVDAIKIRAFDWKAGGSVSHGVIAQELREVCPNTVCEMDGILGADFSKLVPVLVKAIQELTARVEELENAR